MPPEQQNIEEIRHFGAEHRAQCAEDLEGYYTISKTTETVDYDYSPCTGYLIAELGIEVFLYHNNPTMLSIHCP